MLEVVNNYYTLQGAMDSSIWNILSGLGTIVALIASGISLWMHIDTEKKRDTEKKTNNLEKEINFLSGCNTELLAIKEKADEFFEYVNAMPENYEYEFNGIFETPMYMQINRDYFSYYNSNISDIESVSNRTIKNKLVKLHLMYKVLLDDLDLQRGQIDKIDYEIKNNPMSTKIIDEVGALNFQNNQAKNDMKITKELFYELIKLFKSEINAKNLELKKIA